MGGVVMRTDRNTKECHYAERSKVDGSTRLGARSVDTSVLGSVTVVNIMLQFSRPPPRPPSGFLYRHSKESHEYFVSCLLPSCTEPSVPLIPWFERQFVCTSVFSHLSFLQQNTFKKPIFLVVRYWKRRFSLNVRVRIRYFIKSRRVHIL